MSKESWYGDPDYMDSILEEQDMCDYGLSEFCEDPFLKNVNCCFECELYLQDCEEEAEL